MLYDVWFGLSIAKMDYLGIIMVSIYTCVVFLNIDLRLLVIKDVSLVQTWALKYQPSQLIVH